MTTPLTALRLPMYSTTTGRRHVVSWNPSPRFPGQGYWTSLCGLGANHSRCGFHGTTTADTIDCSKCSEWVEQTAARLGDAAQECFDKFMKPRPEPQLAKPSIQAMIAFSKATENLQKYVASLEPTTVNIDQETIETLTAACIEAQGKYQQAREQANPPDPAEVYPSWG